MMLKQLGVTCGLACLFLFGSAVMADDLPVVVSPGDVTIDDNSTGTITLPIISSSGEVTISAFNLYLQIGDGNSANSPIITGVDLKTGTVFASGSTESGGTFGLNSSVLASDISYTSGSTTITTASGQILGTITIDTTGAGVTNARYGVLLENVNGNDAFDSSFNVSDTGTFNVGSIAVGSNPVVLWNGAGADTNLLNFNNWLYMAAPLAGDQIQFAGSTGTAVNMNQTADTAYHSITFNSDAQGFVLDGNSISILDGGAITNNSALTSLYDFDGAGPEPAETVGQILFIDINPAGDLTINAAAGDLTFFGDIKMLDTTTLTIEGASGTTVDTLGDISGSNVLVNMFSQGTLILAGSNNFDTLQATAGITELEGGNAFSNSGVINLDGTAQLNLLDDEAIGSINTVTGTTINLNTSILTLMSGNSVLEGNITDNMPEGDYDMGQAGALAINTNGTVTISGSNTHSLGNIIGNANTSGTSLLGNSATTPSVTIANNSAFGDGGLVFNNGSLIASGNRTIGNNLMIGGNVTFGTGGTLEFTNEVELDGSALDNDDQIGMDLTASSRTLTVNNTTTISGNIIGTKDLIKSGTGSLILTGDNTVDSGFTGDIFVNNGILAVNGTANMNAAGDVTINNGGTFQANSGNAVNDSSAVTVNSGGVFQVLGDETVGFLNGVSGSAVQLSNSSVLTLGATAEDPLADTTFAGNITGTGAIYINADDFNVNDMPGIVSFSGTNNYTGTTVVNQGALLISGTTTTSDASVFGVIGGDGTLIAAGGVQINNGGELVAVDHTDPTTDDIETFNIQGNVNIASGGILTSVINVTGGVATSDLINITGTLTLANGSKIELQEKTGSVMEAGKIFTIAAASGGITNNGALIDEEVAGFGFNAAIVGNNLQLTSFEQINATWISGSNGTFSTEANWDNFPDGVQTDVQDLGLIFTGTSTGANLTVNADEGPYTNIESILFANTTDIFTITGGTLNFNNSLSSAITNNTAQIQTIENNIGTSAVVDLEINAASGDLALSGDIANNNQLTFLGDNDTTASGVISGNGAVVKNGAGMVTLSGTNTYTGNTTLNAGTLLLANDSALGGSGTFNIAGGAIQSDSDSRTIANASSVTGNFTVQGSNLTLSGDMALNSGTRTVTVDNSQTTFSGALSNGALGKSGSGTLILSGANTLSGLNVNAGAVTVTNASGLTGITAVDLAASGAQLNMSGVDLTIDSLSGVAGTVLDTMGQKLTIDGSSTTTFAGVITNAPIGEVEHTGTGMLTLSGDNTYEGTTTITNGTVAITGSVDGDVFVNGGTFIIGNDDALNSEATLLIGSGNIQSDNDARSLNAGVPIYVNGDFAVIGSNELALGGTVNLSGGTRTVTISQADQTTTLSGILSNGGLAKSGSGQLNLTGSNTFANGFTLNAGTVGIGNNNALGTGTFTINGGTIIPLGSGTLTNDITVNGDFTVNGASSVNLTGAVDLNGGTRNITMENTAATTFAGNITNGDLTKDGSQALTLSGSNDFTNGITATQGTVVFNSSNALAADDDVTLSGSGAMHVGADLQVDVLTGTGTGTVSLSTNTLSVNSGSIANVIVSTDDTAVLAKTGPGTLTLSGINTYSGDTDLQGGILQVTNNNALGTGDILANGGTLQGTVDGINLANNGTLNSTLTVNQATGIGLELSGDMSGTGGLNKTGDGTLSLTGANTYSGSTNIQGGTLFVAGNQAISDTGDVTISSGATLQVFNAETIGTLNGDAGSFVQLFDTILTIGSPNGGAGDTIASNISGTGGLTIDGAGVVNLTGTNTFGSDLTINSGTVNLSGGSAVGDTTTVYVDGTLVLNGSAETIGDLSGSGIVNTNGQNLVFGSINDTEFSGAITSTGRVDYSGTGTFTHSGDSTNTGSLFINSGTFNLTGTMDNTSISQLDGLFRLNNVGGDALLDTAGIEVGGGTLQVDVAETIRDLDLGVNANLTLNDNLFLQGDGTTGASLQGTITGTGGLAITGESVVTLSGTNTSTGGISIAGTNASEQSTLTLTGSSTGGTIFVNNFGNLDHSGTSASVTVNNGGNLMTGDGVIDTAAINGNLTVNSGGILDVDISNNNGTLTNDVFGVTGNVTLADNSIIAINDLGPSAIAVDNAFEFMTFGGVLTATVDNVRLQESLSDVAFALSSNGSALSLTAIAVEDIVWDGGGNDGLFTTTTNWDDDVNGVTFDNTTDNTAWNLDGKGITFSGDMNNGSITADNGGNGTITDYIGIASIQFLDTNEDFTIGGLDLNFLDGQTTDIINNSSNDHTINNNINTGTGTMTINANTGDLTFGGTSFVNNGGAIFTGSSLTIVNNVISGSGSVSKTGTGTVELNNANTYTGGTTLANGTLKLGNDAALSTGELTVTGGIINANGDRTLANDINLNGDLAVEGSNALFTGAVTNSGTNTLSINNTQTEFSGNLAGGGIAKDGTGLLILSGSNTLTSLTAGEGTVRLDNASAVTGDTALSILGTAIVDNNSGSDITIDSLTGDSGATLDTNGNKITIDGASTTEFAGDITSAGGELEHTGTGQLTLSGDNTYNGTTTINNGTVAITGSVDGDVNVNGGIFIIGADDAIADGSSLIINAGNLQSNDDARNLSSGVGVTVNNDFAVTGTNDLQLSGAVDLASGSRTITVAEGGTTLQLSGVVSNGGLTKDGSGELYLTGNNTYANDTMLANGTLTAGSDTALGNGDLIINGGAIASDDDARSIANDITVNDGFTIGAVGRGNQLTITGNVDLSGGDADHSIDFYATNTNITGNITGGDLTKIGGGNLILTGTNDFTTGLTVTNGVTRLNSSTAISADDNLTITAGSLEVNSAVTVAALSGGAGGTLNALAAVTFGDATDTTMAAAIQGNSQLTKVGTGTTTLTNSNSGLSSGGFKIDEGTLAVGNANALGQATTTLNGGTLASALDNVVIANNISVTADSAIEADTDLDMILTGVVSGGFAIDKTGAGTLQFNGQNTFSTLNITEGNVVLNNSSNNSLSDTSAVNITGVDSILQLNTDETIGSLAGTAGVVNLQTNTLTTGDATDTDFAGVITGTGGLFKQGAGTMTLSGANTFTGPVTVDNGILGLSNGSALADSVNVTLNTNGGLLLNTNETIGTLAGDGDVALGGNTLGLAGTIDTTYSGVISGTGGVNYNGSGIWTIDNSQTYTGETHIYSGTVNLDGTTLGSNNIITGNVFVHDGTLTGFGQLGGDLDIVGGMVSPGNGAGDTATLDVQGDFFLRSGGIYQADINYNGTGVATTVDQIVATGNITLANGSTIRIGLYDADEEALEKEQHTIAIGATITDNGLVIDEPALVDLSYAIVNGTDLVITIENLLNFQEATVNSVNPKIGEALVQVAAAADNGNPDAIALVNAIKNFSESQLLAYVQQVNDGVDVSALASRNIFQLIQTFANVLENHLSARRDNLPIYAQRDTSSSVSMLAGLTDDPHMLAQVAASEQADQQQQVRPAVPMNQWAGFGKIYGIFSSQDTNSGRSGYSSDGVGIQLGLDYQVNENLIVGVSLDYTNIDTTFDTGLGDVQTNSFRVGPFATYFTDDWFINTSLTFGIHNSDSNRIDTNGDHNADYDATDITLFVGGGYDYHLDENWLLTPTASLRYTYYNRDSYQESGTGGLYYDEYDLNALYSRLGARLSYQLKTMDMLFIPEVTIGWEHEFLGEGDSVNSSFVGVGAFPTSTSSPEENSVFFGTGLTAVIDEQWTTYIRYEGNISQDGETHSITGGVRYDF